MVAGQQQRRSSRWQPLSLDTRSDRICAVSAGAEVVAIPTKRIFDEAWRIEQEGGPYTETLLVKLPKEPEKRRAVWRICEREYQREFGDEWEPSPEDYTPSPEIVDLWWD